MGVGGSTREELRFSIDTMFFMCSYAPSRVWLGPQWSNSMRLLALVHSSVQFVGATITSHLPLIQPQLNGKLRNPKLSNQPFSKPGSNCFVRDHQPKPYHPLFIIVYSARLALDYSLDYRTTSFPSSAQFDRHSIVIEMVDPSRKLFSLV